MSAPVGTAASATEPETLCDRQPVHIPGTIQPHGVLLVLPAGGGVEAPLLAASETIALPPEDGPVRLEALLRPDAVRMLGKALAAPEPAKVEAGALTPAAAGAGALLEGVVSQDGRRWTALVRHGPAATLVELEPEPPPDPAAARLILLDLNQAIATMRQQPDATSACAVACSHLRRISGFDRVMAYRFMADWSGEVVAEALRPDDGSRGSIDSYLGLVFPASDIPAPARALYARNRLRLIPDSAASGSPLRALSGDAAPVDLGDAVLRGVAPVHLQYLSNMKVRASMSVAIALSAPGHRQERGPEEAELLEPKLWGLLACHHQAGPLFVDPMRRQAAETIAHALAWRLAELAEAEAARQARLVQAAQAPFLGPEEEAAAAADGRTGWGDAEAAALLAACEANGLAVVGEAEPTSPAERDPLALRLGALPDEAVLQRLAGWLDRMSPGRALVTDRLGSITPIEGLDAVAASGLLALPLGAAGGAWVLWFRPELRRLVEWAGHKPQSHDPLQALTPRASFAAWREEVAGRSAAWSEGSQAAARAFRDALVTALARRSARVARSNALLRARNAEIRFFADAATHDLKEPLWQVQVLCGLIRDGLAELFGPTAPGEAPHSAAHAAVALEVAELELEAMAGRVVVSAGRMRDMIDELARFAVAGRDPERLQPVGLRRLAEEAIDDLGAALRGVPDATVSLEGLGELTLSCDAPQIRRLFQNLFSNALKYRAVARPLLLEVTAERRVAGGVMISVADNGVGFEAADRRRMFEPFRRLDRHGAAASEGLGLGLAICARIAEAHGGSIEAVQRVPGARFDIVLPAGQAGPAEAGEQR